MKYILIIIFFLFAGCSSTSQVEKIFQSDDSSYLQDNYNQITKLIIKYKIKLDKRNPSGYNKQLSKQLIYNIKHSKNNMIHYQNKKIILKTYVDYFNYAFDPDPNIKYRNDYLIIGLFKLTYHIYLMDINHKFSAYGFDIDRLQIGYKNLQILQWKISNAKDNDGKYLFNTWQQNWQIELLQRYNKDKKIDYLQIKDLEYLKTNKESLLNASNNSFAILLYKIMFNVENSINILDMKPIELTKEILKGAFFIF